MRIRTDRAEGRVRPGHDDLSGVPQQDSGPSDLGHADRGQDGEAAFREYVTAHGAALLRIALLFTGNRADAEDLLQAALAKTYLAWDRIQDRAALDAYVRRAMVNTQISWWRRRCVAEFPTEDIPDWAVAEHLPPSELEDTVRRALDRLPRRMRAAVMLRYYEDMSEPEIADALGVSRGTVKSTVSRAVAKLRIDAELAGCVPGGPGGARSLRWPNGAASPACGNISEIASTARRVPEPACESTRWWGVRSTMMDVPLTVTSIMQYGTTTFRDKEVVTNTGEGVRRQTYAEVARRAARLANALRRLGVDGDQRVATFMWNNAEHLEAYLAVPSMGAVLHTLNIRLSPAQIGYIATHADDFVVIVDASLVPLLAEVLPHAPTIRHVIVAGMPAGEPVPGAQTLTGPGREVHGYEELLAAGPDSFGWPEVNEKSAASMCYTSGTTGNPKGVVYSHRSVYLHAMGPCLGNAFGFSERDRVLPVVPMFHVNSWGFPFSAVLCGATTIMPDRHMQPAAMVRLIESERPTVAAGVPTIWQGVLEHVRAHGGDLSSLRMVIAGGSAVPHSLMKAYDELGVTLVQAWGMTETSPLGSVAVPPAGVTGAKAWPYRDSAGRLFCTVQARLTGDGGAVLPQDGETVGEIEVRGPWVTGAYYKDDDPAKFHDGWLRTGDVGSIDEGGFIRINDRSKDVIKSGGEWISSVELENALMAHPDVLEAAVIGVPDDKWGERPFAAVVVRDGADLSAEHLRDHLAASVPRWQLPERWAYIDEVPKTSVGKFSKRTMREAYAHGEYKVIQVG